VRDFHIEIINDHGEIIGRAAVGSSNDQVVELRIVENDCAPDLVVDDDFTVERTAKTNDRIHTLARLPAIAATPVVSDLLTLGELPGTKFVKLPFCAVAAIGLAFFEPFFDNRVVSFESPGLKKRTFVGVQTQPVA
jgi:hypothetical protein